MVVIPVPMVSVIIPAHNRSALLAEAVVSCLIQTWEGIEVVVVDDGSEDALHPALSQAQALFGGREVVRYVRQARAGAPAARNRGLAEATGEFIQFLDSDDLLHPEKLERQMAVLQSDPRLDMVFCLDEWFHREIGDMGLLWNSPDGRAEIERFAWNDVLWNSGSPLWRRRALDKVGPWDTWLACWQDWELHVRALACGIREAHLSEALQFTREHSRPRVSANSSLDHEVC